MNTSRITELQSRLSRESFNYLTLERARGETYASTNPVLYGHGTYERSSVLAGQSRRVNLESWDTIEDARADLAAAKIKHDDNYDEGGTSHVPVEQVIAHIPENDYDRENVPNVPGGANFVPYTKENPGPIAGSLSRFD